MVHVHVLGNMKQGWVAHVPVTKPGWLIDTDGGWRQFMDIVVLEGLIEAEMRWVEWINKLLGDD